MTQTTKVGKLMRKRAAINLLRAMEKAGLRLDKTTYGNDVDLSDVHRTRGVDSQSPPGGQNLGKKKILN
jgi:hypothetical protein